MGINDQTTNDLTYYYNSFLLKEQDNHKEKYKEFDGWFSASSAGSCFRKQYYNVNNYEQTPVDEKSLRLFRLGTIVHADIAKAFETYREDIESRGLKLFVEHKVILEDLNVVGHLDVGVYDENEGLVYVTDVKTTHSYKWKKMFGRTPDKNPSVNYYLQVATYGLGLCKEVGEEPENIELSLTWYKKDDSSIKAQRIDNDWISQSIKYWLDLKMSLRNDNVPEINSKINSERVVPIYDWECKYCPYLNLHCEGV